MNILVVVGACLRQNSSANLCHNCYIQGLLDLGYSVDLITVDEKINLFGNKTYGYFGDYAPHVRNLKPFYNVASTLKLNTNICGNPNNLFESTDTVKIHHRLPLNKLKFIEDKTNV